MYLVVLKFIRPVSNINIVKKNFKWIEGGASLLYKFPSSHSGKTLFDRGRNVLMGEMIRDYWQEGWPPAQT